MMFQWLLLSLLTLNNSLLTVDIWVDKEDAVYYPTENLKIFFQTNQDCYVAVYDIETGGRVNLLFPPEGENGWVQAGRIYQLPPEMADYDYVVSGSEGIETIVAVASIKRPSTLSDEEPDAVKKTIEIYISEPEPAKLRIISAPKQCRIYITDVESGDKEYVDKTPRTIVLKPGEYLIKLEKFGFRTLTRRIWLEPGDRRRIFANLMGY